MKRYLSFILCAVLAASLTVGCGDNGGSSASTPESSSASTAASQSSPESSGAEAEEPVELLITRPLYFGDVSDYPDLKEEWMTMVEEKYGIKVTINALARNEYTQKVNLLMTSKDVTGLVGVFSTNEILMYKDQNAIEPVGDYLANNETWKSMPEDMQNLYVFDGDLWGLPAGFTKNMFVRTMRKDWLDNLGLSVPTNMDEFYEVVRAFTYDDPDGNGVKDTYGLTAAGTWNLQDIFQSFNARLNTDGSRSITYDPEANAWIDTMLKPEMAECLTFLNKLYTEGILDPEVFTNKGSMMRENFWSGKAGSTFYWLGFSGDSRPYLEKLTPDVEFVEIPYMSGNIDKNINHVWYGTIPYIMVKGTENADRMINEAVDLMLGSQDSHFDFAYGIEGKTYRVEDNTVYTLMDENAGTLMPNAGLTSSIPAYYDDWNFLSDALDDAGKKTAQELLDFKKSVAAESIASGCMYSISESQNAINSATWQIVGGDIDAAFETAVSSAITGSVPVDQAIAKYLDEVKGLGAQQVLDELNDFCGYTSDLKY